MFYKIIDIAKRAFDIIISFVVVIISLLTIFGTIYNIKISNDVKSFISKATFEEETATTRFYAVYTDDIIDDDVIDKRDGIEPILGAPGDIFIMPESMMDMVPLLKEFLTVVIGGHAGMIADNDETIESMGGIAEEAFVFSEATDLYTEERSVIGLRARTNKANRLKANSFARSKLGYDYNYFFFLAVKDKYYCSDLCSRAYGKENGINLNLDQNGGIVTIQDLAISKDTYISFVKIHHNGKVNIYYLKNRV